MLLTELHELVKLGAEKPLAMWQSAYQAKSRGLAAEFSVLTENLESGTGVRENIEHLVEVLKADNPSEADLAKTIFNTAELFKEQTVDLPELEKISVLAFIKDSKKFYDRTQTEEILARERERVKATMSKDEQAAYDRRLFELEGMMYCLEYYLTLYKAIIDAPDELVKRKIIESTEVDCGSGKIPGLWFDFNQDEVLQKFILKILNNDLRQELKTAYYTTKEKIVKIKLTCDKQDSCQAFYEDVTLEEVVAAFKDLIKAFIAAFQKVGIEQLSSYFLTPFGKNTKLSDIKL